MTATRRFVGGIGWVASSFAMAQVLRFVQAVIVARWLGPEEMGLYAYVYSILALIELMEKIGAEQVFIARSPSDPDGEARWLNGCWTMRLALALAAAAATLAVSGAIGALGGGARLAGLLTMLAAIPPLMALRSARLMRMQKTQDFATLSRFDLGAAVVRTALPVAMVYAFRSVEWLVAANVIAAALIALASHLLFPLRHALRLPREVARELYFYGRNSVAVGALTVAHTTLDDLAIGTFIGRSALGAYSLGYRLAMTPFSLVQAVAIRVLVPQYRLAHDAGPAALAARWRAAFGLLTLAYAGLMGVFVLGADLGVATVFGPEWQAMGGVLVFAAFIAFFRGAAVTISPLLVIARAPHVDARMKLAEVALFLVFVGLGSWLARFDLFLWGGVVSYAAAFVLRVVWWHRWLGRAGAGGIGAGDLAQLGGGLGVLLLTLAARGFGVPLAISLPVLVLAVAWPVLRRARGLVREFAA